MSGQVVRENKSWEDGDKVPDAGHLFIPLGVLEAEKKFPMEHHRLLQDSQENPVPLPISQHTAAWWRNLPLCPAEMIFLCLGPTKEL